MFDIFKSITHQPEDRPKRFIEKFIHHSYGEYIYSYDDYVWTFTVDGDTFFIKIKPIDTLRNYSFRISSDSDFDDDMHVDCLEDILHFIYDITGIYPEGETEDPYSSHKVDLILVKT